ncbi:phosphatidylglycerophosphatase A [Desulfatiferula olefinivorans]
MKITDKHIMFIATGGGAGRAKTAPGTVGTLVGIPLYGLLSFFDTPALWPVICLSVIALIILAVVVADRAVAILNADDPGCVVIDEIAGFLVTTAGIGFSLPSVILGFLLFRLFDIWKPFPVRYLEDTLPGGAGVVLDDVAAGIMAHIVLRVLLAVF